MRFPQGHDLSSPLRETFRMIYKNQYSQSKLESQDLTNKKKTIYNSLTLHKAKRFAFASLDTKKEVV
jgi:hypothetical protein